jgi:pilus assembly protein Flp/PilA
MLQKKRADCWAAAARFSRNDLGATAVEYGLIIGVIGLAIVVCLSAYGPAFQEVFSRLGAHMAAPPNAPGGG